MSTFFGKVVLMVNIAGGSYGAVMAITNAFKEESLLLWIGIGMVAVGYGLAISTILVELRVALREHRAEMAKLLSPRKDS